jgi:hypothetical protein
MMPRNEEKIKSFASGQLCCYMYAEMGEGGVASGAKVPAIISSPVYVLYKRALDI